MMEWITGLRRPGGTEESEPLFPIGDENRAQRLTPVVNYALIALNVLIFLYQITLPDTRANPALTEFVFRWGAVPIEISDRQDLHALVTSQFLHGGWLHIAGNMLFLWVFGDNVEDTLGHVSYLTFYLLGGVAAALAQVFIDPESQIPLVGASGAIAAVLGAYIVLFPRGKIRTAVLIGFIPIIFLLPAWVNIGLWIVLQFVNGFASLGVRTEETGGGVAYFAHIGGFLAGIVLVWIFRDGDAHERQLAARQGTRAFQRVSWSDR